MTRAMSMPTLKPLVVPIGLVVSRIFLTDSVSESAAESSRWIESARVLIFEVEDAGHYCSRGITIQEGIGILPAIAVRGADRTHFVVVQHHGSVWDVDDECVMR